MGSFSGVRAKGATKGQGGKIKLKLVLSPPTSARNVSRE